MRALCVHEAVRKGCVRADRTKGICFCEGSGHDSKPGLALIESTSMRKQPRLDLPSLYRGLYSRIARKLGVDRGYVSRVARGERRSEEVQQAIEAELERLSLLGNKRHKAASS